jgi:hypothetical protein
MELHMCTRHLSFYHYFVIDSCQLQLSLVSSKNKSRNSRPGRVVNVSKITIIYDQLMKYGQYNLANKPLEWTGRHRFDASSIESLPATQGQRYVITTLDTHQTLSPKLSWDYSWSKLRI